MISQKGVSVADMHQIEIQSQSSITFVVNKESEKPTEVTLKHPSGEGYIRIRPGSYGGSLEVDVVSAVAKPKA